MRYALGLEYDGSEFLGWQLQREQPTVQGCVEQAVAVVANHEVRLHCCGRTDTGVHARCQVAHFDTRQQGALVVCGHWDLVYMRPIFPMVFHRPGSGVRTSL